MDTTIFLSVIGLLAGLVILGTFIVVIVILRRPSPVKPNSRLNAAVGADGSDLPLGEFTDDGSDSANSDFDSSIGEQPVVLAEFELQDLSTSFKGNTVDGQRKGTIMHITTPDTPLINFSSEAFNPQNGAITAETAYGLMELTIAQGKAMVKWEGEPLGVLDYSAQRILGSEGQLLGSMERPLPDSASSREIGAYPIGFFGQKAADVVTIVNAVSTLRWLDSGDESETHPAFKDVMPELEDVHTLILLSASLLEIGFFDLVQADIE